jgi:hypothetical protein
MDIQAIRPTNIIDTSQVMAVMAVMAIGLHGFNGK